MSVNPSKLHQQTYQYLQQVGINAKDGITPAELTQLDTNKNGALEQQELAKVALQDSFKLQNQYAQNQLGQTLVLAPTPEQHPESAHHTTVGGVLTKHTAVMVGEEILHHAAAKMARSSNSKFATTGHKLENNALPVIGAVSAGYLAYQSFSHMASAIDQGNTKAAVAYGLAGTIDTAIAGFNVYTLVTQKPPVVSRTVGTALGVAATGLAMTGAYLENNSH